MMMDNEDDCRMTPTKILRVRNRILSGYHKLIAKLNPKNDNDATLENELLK